MGVYRHFPYSNFHEMNMDEIIKIIKNMLEEWANYHAEWDAWMTKINDDWSNYQEVMNEAWQNMQDFINNYFDNLDVQNEINNKIVSMVASGEFSSIVAPYIPPRVTEWLTAHITQPVGVVIDTSLTVAGACADAKATGDAIRPLSSIITDNLMGVDVQQNLYEGSADWSGTWINSDPANMSITSNKHNGYPIAHSNESWRRLYKEIPVEAGKIYTFQATINQAVAGTVFLFITRENTTNPATINQSMFQFNNQPNDTWLTLSGTFTVTASGNVSPYALSDGGAFSLVKYTLVEGEQVFSLVDALNEKADASIEEKTDVITLNKNILEDLSVTTNKVYERTTAIAVDNEYCNIYPPISIKSGKTYYFRNLYAYFCVIKYVDNTSVNLSDDTSTILSGSFTASKNGTIYISVSNRRSGFVFTDSKELYDSGMDYSFATIDVQNLPKEYHVEKDGSGDFDSLVDAIEEATKYLDSKVYVGAGTWDLISELGSDYIDTVDSAQRGIYLKNRVHLIFNPKAIVECIYEGSRADTIAWLSAFNAGERGFTLENANIKTGNIRYCVHDERDTDPDFYTNIYKNCVMYHDSSYAQGGQNQCIGGGLGLNGHIVVEGCVFENPNINNATVVSWHNSSGANAKSLIDVHGCYVRGTNTMRFRYYGSTPNTQKSTVLCHDNSVGSNIIFGPETESSTNENMELLEWNNEVRS